MTPLLSAAGEAALVEMFDSRPLLAFDFDGTLSPMVMLPWQARMPAGVANGFRRLCEMRPVAVITGRSIDDLVPRLPIMPKYVVGNHGAEGLPDEEANASQYRAVCESWMKQIRDVLQWEKFDPGLMVEHKPFSLCLHYRLARDRQLLAKRINASLPHLDPLPQVIDGIHGINLLPPGAPTKSKALRTLLDMESRHAAFFVGDDETDEVVFRNAPSHWVTVRVGRETDSAARFFLRHQSEMTECLHILAKISEKN